MSTRLAGQPRSELSQRVISGLAMAAVTLVALWLGKWPFGAMLVIGSVVASWEWGRIVRGFEFDRYFLWHAAVVAQATLVATAGFAVPAAVGLMAGAAVLIALRLGSRDQLSGLGVLVIGFAAVSLARLRADSPFGLEAVLFLFAVVWMTDIGGYVFGRSIGGPKLWPAVSPGKTWAGAIGGLVLATVTSS